MRLSNIADGERSSRLQERSRTGRQGRDFPPFGGLDIDRGQTSNICARRRIGGKHRRFGRLRRQDVRGGIRGNGLGDGLIGRHRRRRGDHAVTTILSGCAGRSIARIARVAFGERIVGGAGVGNAIDGRSCVHAGHAGGLVLATASSRSRLTFWGVSPKCNSPYCKWAASARLTSESANSRLPPLIAWAPGRGAFGRPVW